MRRNETVKTSYYRTNKVVWLLLWVCIGCCFSTPMIWLAFKETEPISIAKGVSVDSTVGERYFEKNQEGSYVLSAESEFPFTLKNGDQLIKASNFDKLDIKRPISWTKEDYYRLDPTEIQDNKVEIAIENSHNFMFRVENPMGLNLEMHSSPAHAQHVYTYTFSFVLGLWLVILGAIAMGFLWLLPKKRIVDHVSTIGEV